jgi:hypothetical protein
MLVPRRAERILRRPLTHQLAAAGERWRLPGAEKMTDLERYLIEEEKSWRDA